MIETPHPILPDVMDVVWCAFPYDETPGVPGNPPHPGLVFQVNEFRQGEYAVKVAFGTSVTSRPMDGPGLKVANFNQMMVAGLNKVTLFDLGRFRWLPWTSKWFCTPDPRRWSAPIIGKLNADGQAYLQTIMARRTAMGLKNP